jgi:hypothetical protein
VTIDRSPQLAAGALRGDTPGTGTGRTAPAFPFLTGPCRFTFPFTFTFNFFLARRPVLHWAYARIAQLSTLEGCMHVDR